MPTWEKLLKDIQKKLMHLHVEAGNALYEMGSVSESRPLTAEETKIIDKVRDIYTTISSLR